MQTDSSPSATPPGRSAGFIRSIVADHLRSGEHETIVTHFPPEPNGYLHVGHAKSIVLNFGIAAETEGRCHLRFDDTNPETEDAHYVESIQDVVRWLGFDWGEQLYFASDYFDEMYRFAEFLIQKAKAYVDSSTEEEVREARGTVTEPGRPTRFRGRSVEESLDLFRRMRDGEFPDGSQVLRGKIDLASPNMLLRDPILYRVRHAHHYRTGDTWRIYPLYDYAHPIEDAIEGVTHSLCTLEFENNRPLYNWAVAGWQDFVRSRGEVPTRPRQYEFARLNLDYTVLSKRKLLELVEGGYVSGWDDPRMPTLAGLRRRGFTPTAIRAFCELIGVAKMESRVDMGKLEYTIRGDLNQVAPRVLCVLQPLRVVITNYPAGESEEIEAPYFPHDVPKEGSRRIPFSRELFIDRDDFSEDPPKGFYRLFPGGEVRLRHAYIIRCHEVVKDGAGEVVELRCTHDPESRGGMAPDGRVVRGTIQWVSAQHSLPCEVRLYDRLFTVPAPEAEDADFKVYLNPESLVAVKDARIEPSVRSAPAGTRYQFERLGYFCSDIVESARDALIFNRTVTLRDTWARRIPQAQRERSGQRKANRPEGRVTRAGSEGEAVVAATQPAGVDLPEFVGASPSRVQTPEQEALAVLYAEEWEIPREDAELLARDAAVARLFETALDQGASPGAVANWIIHELPRALQGRTLAVLPFEGRQLGSLVALVERGAISGRAGREVLAEIVRNGGEPATIVESRGMRQVSDPNLLVPVVEGVIAANKAKAEEYRGGRTRLLGFFVGLVMQQTGGNANPERVKDLLEERLGN